MSHFCQNALKLISNEGACLDQSIGATPKILSRTETEK